MTTEATTAKSGKFKVSIYRLQIKPGQWTASWYYKPMKNGERHLFSLGQFLNNYTIKAPNGKQVKIMGARAIADEIYAFLRSRGATMQAAIGLFDPERQEKKATLSSGSTRIQDVVDVYLDIGKRMGVNPTTQRHNILMLATIMRRAQSFTQGQPFQSLSGKRDGAGRDKLFQAPLASLTKDLVVNFQHSMLAEADEEDVALEKKKRRSANSLLTQARSIFAERYRDEYESAGLAIPPDWSFLKAPKLRGGAMFFVLPKFDVIQTIIDRAPKLRSEEPAAYRAFVLAIHCSCRRSEADNCRWEWFSNGDRCSMRIATDGSFDPKHGHGREVIIQDFVHRDLLAMKNDANADYVITDTEHGREHAFRELSKWLRDCGVDAVKPYHELRKLWFSVKVKTDGLLAASQQGGHRDVNVTSKHYADNLMPDSLVGFWTGG